MRNPRDVGAVTARARGEFELFLVQGVDNRVMRLDCAPEIERQNGVHTHQVFDHQQKIREVIVLRQWEANRLKNKLPLSMRKGRLILYTGTWESIPLCWAVKDIHEASRFPYFHDPTLPQHRLDNARPRPLQDDYPVWYFLTGPIAKPNKLRKLLKRETEPHKRCATVHGLTTLRHRQFEATVETDFHDEHAILGPSVGAAYIIKSKEEEDRLRYFKTDHFMVVRCKITLCPILESGQPHEVDGLTFVVDLNSSLYNCLRNIRPSEMSIPPTSAEPCLPFEGYDYVRLEGADKGNEPIDRKLYAYIFPRLRTGRNRPASDVYQRRDFLRSPLRPRSLLMGIENESDTPSMSISQPKRFKSRIPVPSGNYVRSSQPRAGGVATTCEIIMPTTSESSTPSETSSSEIERFIRMLRGMMLRGIVPDIEDFGRWRINDEVEQTTATTDPTEPEDVDPSNGTSKGQDHESV